MNIRNRERKFLLTVRGRDEIARLCPNEDLSKIADVFRNSTQTDAMRKLILVMNRDYEDYTRYHDNSYEVDYLTDEDIQMLKMEEFRTLQDEASNAFLEGMGITVDVEEPKGKKTRKAKGPS